MHPHPAGNGVYGVVAAHVFHKHQHLLAPEERASMDRARAFVGALLQANGVDDAVKLGLREPGWRQLDGAHIVHQGAEHAALAAAGGDHPA